MWLSLALPASQYHIRSRPYTLVCNKRPWLCRAQVLDPCKWKKLRSLALPAFTCKLKLERSQALPALKHRVKLLLSLAMPANPCRWRVLLSQALPARKPQDKDNQLLLLPLFLTFSTFLSIVGCTTRTS